MAKGITEVIEDFKVLHPLAYERIIEIGKSKQIWEICLANKKDDTAIEILDMMHWAYQKGVKEFAKFLIDKGIDGFEMPDLVAEFLQESEE